MKIVYLIFWKFELISLNNLWLQPQGILFDVIIRGDFVENLRSNRCNCLSYIYSFESDNQNQFLKLLKKRKLYTKTLVGFRLGNKIGWI